MPRRNRKNARARKENSGAKPENSHEKTENPPAKPESSHEKPESSSTPSQPTKKDSTGVPCYNYNPGQRVDISVEHNGGLLKEVIKPGTGEFMPARGSRVFVHYLGFTRDSVIIYNTKDLQEPRSFIVGEGTVMRGIELGVTTMRKGEVAIFTCKLPYYTGVCIASGPRAHYAKTGVSPPFGPQHPVYFKVELIAWKDADISPAKDGSIQKRLMELGEGNLFPTEGNIVDIHLTCEYENKIYQQRRTVFCLGNGKNNGIPKGIEMALRTFKVKEKSRLILSPQYAWGVNERPRYGIPAKAKVTYYVKLNNIIKSRKVEEVTIGENLVRAIILKEQGTELYKNGIYPLAITAYGKMLECLHDDVGTLYQSDDGRLHFIADDVSDENTAVVDNLKCIGHLNIAACLLKMEAFSGAKGACNKVLSMNPKSEKGLYRRGQANMGLGLLKEAVEDFEAVLKVNPNNTAAEENLKLCKEKLTDSLVHERNLFRSMFI